MRDDHKHVSEPCPRCTFPRCSICWCEYPTIGVMDFNCDCNWADPRFQNSANVTRKEFDELKSELDRVKRHLNIPPSGLRTY